MLNNRISYSPPLDPISTPRFQGDARSVILCTVFKQNTARVNNIWPTSVAWKGNKQPTLSASACQIMLPNTHSALFWGLRFTQFWTSTCGIPNWPEWSPRPDFDGLDQFHHWTLRKSQGEAGCRMPNLLVWSANKVPEGGVTGKNVFSKIHSKFY